MKKIIAIIAIAIATIATANAKVVKGHVNDRDGYPVEGIRIAVVDEDNNGKRTIIRTDENGYFELRVPDTLDVSVVKDLFSTGVITVRDFKNTRKGLEITIDVAVQLEKAICYAEKK